MLKKLELFGFKSFPNKTTFDFSKGITAIVGPNGCGKSNISDAIRWVLGEQRTKPLRGEKMEDFVFSGTQAKRPMNMAEVSITLDNSTGVLDLDYEEITVKRKFYRSGDSEYFINKTPCRLKDILETFMDTGIGKDTYSIISQGEIDKILSASPEERRYLFEEASGILKHKTRKKEALKRLDDTKGNLARVSDIIEELNYQLPSLREQGQKAKKYKELVEELKLLEVNLLAHRIEEKKSSWYKFDNNQKRLETNLQEITTALRAVESELESTKKNLVDLEKNLEYYQQENVSVVTELEKNQGEEKILGERTENLTNEKTRLIEERSQVTEEIKKAEDKYNQITKQYQTLLEQKDSLTEKLRKLKTELEQMSRNTQNIEEAKGNLIEIINKIQQEKSSYSNLLKDKERLSAEIEELNDDLNSKSQYSTTLNNQMQASQEKNDSIQNRMDELVTKLTTLKTEVTELEKNEDKLHKQENEKKNSLQQYKSRLEMMDEFYDSDGFSQGIRTILKLKKQNPKIWGGVKGTVSQLISVDEPYMKAIEISLGRALQNIVTDTDKTAKDVLEYLKNKKLGRATCLPLDNLSSRTINEKQSKIISKHSVHGIASDLISMDERYQVVAKYLLGRVVIVPSMDIGLALARDLKYSLKLVTIEGEIILPGGAMVGGSLKQNSNNSNSLLKKDNNKSTIQKKINDLNKELTTIHSEKVQTSEKLKQKKSTLENLLSERHQLDLEYREIKKDLERINQEKDRLEEEKEVIELKIKGKRNELSSIEEQLAQSSRKIDSLENNKTKLKQYIEDISDNHDEEQKEYDKMNERKLSLQVDLGKLDERLKKTTEEKQELEVFINNYKDKKLPETLTKIEEIDEKLKKTEKEKIENKNRRQNLLDKQEQISYTLDNLKKQREEVRYQLQEKEDDHKKYAQKEKSLEKELSQIKMKKSRVETELESILERLNEQYELDYEQAFKYKKPIEDFKAHEKNIAKLQKQIKELGSVNVGAIEEYERLEERLEFLQGQQQDLLKAEDSLKRVLSEIDSTMIEKFSKTVDQINKVFDRVFKEVYHGGSAQLQYTDESNLLNTGIDIIAKPPGKKKQNLSLLSGGERALTVIALLFAVHEIKPTPFCILDEVDASLDEKNLEILTEFFSNYSQKTQFIIITHRKTTMLAADRFYGITMSNPGVSQLISVKLDDYNDVTESA
ncbi:chromosome segregation protein SMC [Natranaerobius trueperi]|uniref:chromosome segregation protein SMC n=1 Tax=Natranaerobius trueperi TaxID=759412 RepID=UPI0013034D57|nr:chromosome segregation protein SMC [Natranaerobius trueperi]